MRMWHGEVGQLAESFASLLALAHDQIWIEVLELSCEPGSPGCHLIGRWGSLQDAGNQIKERSFFISQSSRFEVGFAEKSPALTGQGNSSRYFDPVGRCSDKDRLCVLSPVRLHLRLEEHGPLRSARDDGGSSGP